MKQCYRYFLLCMLITFLFACSSTRKIDMPGTSATSFEHAKWSEGSNVYEVNLRQYSKEGTIKEFAKSLPRLKKMGVQILWFMPLTPIGVVDKKMNESELGSYYAVKNYKEVNPEFGTMDDWKAFVKNAHEQGFKVIIDWVANHSAPDNIWATTHPQFYTRDSTGNMVSPFDWTDTRKLNYENRELRDSMIAAMKFWLHETGIDGFRCDVAEEVPLDFWKECITELKRIKNVFMLAEGEKPELHYAGFDATYTWSIMHLMKDVYEGNTSVAGFDSVLNEQISSYPVNAYRLYFTTNHDENSWNGTEFEKYGDAYKAFAVFSQTMYQSIPLIYSGQEVPNKKRLKFFVKDTIEWNQFEMAPFYSKLLHLRAGNKALDQNANYKRIATANDDAIFCYTREKGGNKIAVVLNLCGEPQSFTIKEKEIYGKATDIFGGASVRLRKNYVYTLKPWDFLVFEYD